MVAGRQPTPNLWKDAWLAALARSLDHELVTFDRGFKSFDGIKLNLLDIEGVPIERRLAEALIAGSASLQHIIEMLACDQRTPALRCALSDLSRMIKGITE
jgi:hypothetical protein